MTLHLFAIGQAQAAAAAVDRWAPFGDVRLWALDDLPAGARDLIDATAGQVLPIDRVRHAANIARLVILQDHGGVWVDTDTYPFASLDPLGPGPWTASLAGRTVPAFLACPAGHPWPSLTLELIATRQFPQPRPSPVVSGGAALDTVRPADVALVPAGRLFERDSRGRLIPAPPEGRLATHAWATSSTRR